MENTGKDRHLWVGKRVTLIDPWQEAKIISIRNGMFQVKWYSTRDGGDVTVWVNPAQIQEHRP